MPLSLARHTLPMRATYYYNKKTLPTKTSPPCRRDRNGKPAAQRGLVMDSPIASKTRAYRQTSAQVKLEPRQGFANYLFWLKCLRRRLRARIYTPIASTKVLAMSQNWPLLAPYNRYARAASIALMAAPTKQSSPIT